MQYQPTSFLAPLHTLTAAHVAPRRAVASAPSHQQTDVGHHDDHVSLAGANPEGEDLAQMVALRNRATVRNMGLAGMDPRTMLMVSHAQTSTKSAGPLTTQVTVQKWGEGQNSSLEGILRGQGYSAKEIYDRSSGSSLLDRVAASNNLKNPNLIYTGQTLQIPARPVQTASASAPAASASAPAAPASAPAGSTVSPPGPSPRAAKSGASWVDSSTEPRRW